MPYRKLTDSEISRLKNQGCTSEDWQKIQVKENFIADTIHRVHFNGDNCLGVFDRSYPLPGGMNRSCGIYDSTIHQCTIGDQATISNVQMLANYVVEENVVIENVISLVVDGETTFGNGTVIDVLNEAGGRTLKIFDQLSSQIAYLMVFYRYNPRLVKKLERLIDRYVESKRSTQGILKQGCRIVNSQTLVNVEVGPYATVSGALRLEEGTIGSCQEDPTFVGSGVIAKKFIILSGSKIDESVLLFSCFVGQSVKMGKQYSAENSAFFANSELFHGEGCSVFAGPYTVTHHKSSLLIAGCYSFYNAGSGTNQSNHMYKLGPVHQGILERGSKTGSFCYLLWPCKVGPFTNVIGKHYINFDTSDLPFSFINEENGRSVVVPGMNLFTVGTRRDSVKWPARDRRKGPEKLDLIHFGLLTPYTIGKMVDAIEQLKSLYEKTPKTQEYVNYKGISIDRLMIKTCLKYYEMAIKIFIGDVLVKHPEFFENNPSLREMKNKMKKAGEGYLSKWLDVFGLIASQESIKQVIEAIEKDRFETVQELQNRLKQILHNYESEEWSWCLRLIEKRLNIRIENVTLEQLKELIRDWKINCIKLNNMILLDAGKEFDSAAAIGFGMDGGEVEQSEDFKAVRGTMEANGFVLELNQDTKRVEQTTEKIISLLDRLGP